MSSDRNDVVVLSPLDCTLCKNEMRDPVRLTCQHCFCKACVQSKSTCPICETSFCPLKLVVDRVLSYVIESSHETSESCANCDKVTQPMSFCETCRQPLCQSCVAVTHSAKFFASHHISPLEERGKLRGDLYCTDHNGPFVLYCQEAKTLMCIECFNNSSLERRNNFVNIDVAHKICREKLDKSVIRLRSLLNELSEQINIRKRLLAETESKFATTSEQVLDKYNEIVETFTKKKDQIMEEINLKSQTQVQQIQHQITALSNMEGPIRSNLLSASVFCSYASNLDLLHCYSDLSKNINAVMSHKLEKISSKDNTQTDFVESLIAVLHDLDLKLADANKENSDEHTASAFPFVSLDFWKRLDQRVRQDPSSGSRSLSPLCFNYMSQSGAYSNNSAFLLDSVITSFDEQFQKIDTPLKQFSEETNSISKELLDLQRDITLRRCLLDKQAVDKLFQRCETLSNQLNAHNALILQIKPLLTDIWNEHLEVLYKQQSLVQNRLNEFAKLECFAQAALDIGQKLRPLSNFLHSIISVVDNRRSGVSPIPPMEQICMEILNILPDSKQRIEAIEAGEKQRCLTRESEKAAAEEEVRALKKNLKDTKKSRQRPISMVVVEQNRDRDDTISPRHSQKLSKRLKRPSQSDENSSVCSTSPRTLSSTVSLDATSLQVVEPSSSNSLSPLPSKRSESAMDILGPVTPPPPKSPPIIPIVVGNDTPLVKQPVTPPPPKSPPIIPVVTGSDTPLVKQPVTLPPPKSPPIIPVMTGSDTSVNKQPVNKPLISLPVPNGPSAETVKAKNLLIQAIKEKVKRID